ncbi:MAG: Hint domain-containing protein [Pseudomonadota bacterium]
MFEDFDFTNIYVVYTIGDSSTLSSYFNSQELEFNPGTYSTGFWSQNVSVRVTEGDLGQSGDTVSISGQVYNEAYEYYDFTEEWYITSVELSGQSNIAGVTESGEVWLESLYIDEIDLALIEFDAETFEILNEQYGEEPIGLNFSLFLTNETYFEGEALPDMDPNAVLVCFASGTGIATPTGTAPVEQLSIGDLVMTGGGRAIPVKWIGHQTVDHSGTDEGRATLIRFSRGAIAPEVPCRDLTVTCDHGIIIDGVICHAGALVNGTTIRRLTLDELPRRSVVYHVETQRHDIILADGVQSETFVDNVTRQSFDNFDEYEVLYGDETPVPEMAMPRARGPRQVPASIKAKLHVAAHQLDAERLDRVA